MNKKLFLLLVFTVISMSLFAEKKEYLSADYKSLGVIELTKDNDINLVNFTVITLLPSPDISKMQRSILLKFKNYSDAKAFYLEKTKIKDNYDDFFEVFKEIRDSEKVFNAKDQTFVDRGVSYQITVVDYDASVIKEDRSVSESNIDPNYAKVTIKELNSNQEKYNNTKVSIFQIKLLGEDPKDSYGNIPAVVYEDKSNVIIVKISPKCISDFNKNKNGSINYYGTFIKESEYRCYILVDKITSNSERKTKSIELDNNKRISKPSVNDILPLIDMIKIPKRNYELSKTEVTQKLYYSVMGENPSKFKADNKPVESVNLYDAIYFCNRLSEICGLRPCYKVNGTTDVTKWNYSPHIDEFIDGEIVYDTGANGYRLPTNDEWEYAAKSGKNYMYSGSDNPDEVAWYNGEYNEGSHVVAAKKSNSYGLYDMSGNVDEWCWKFSPETQSSVARGGNWSCSFLIPLSVNSSVDISFGASYRSAGLGFRICRNQ